MAASETVTIKGTEYIARPLTMLEIRNVMEEVEDKKRDLSLVDLLFEDGIPSPAFFRSLRIDEKEIDNLYPEQVKELMEAVAAANPIYAAMEKRVAAGLEQLQENLKEFAAG